MERMYAGPGGRTLRVRIVCYDDESWIIGKFASKLRDGLRDLSVDVVLGDARDPTADINHHLIYLNVVSPMSRSDTLMVTHVDDIASLQLLKRQLSEGATGICMSSDTMNRLASAGVPPAQLCYILPAHDGVLHPRPLLIGIATRIYPQDGRKREGVLLDLAARILPDEFRFVIIGEGWNGIVAKMRARSFSVDYHPAFELQLYHDTMRSLDYYLYLGNDEGSMGFVDALAAAVPTIVTPQGFHLDAAGGVTHSFSAVDELVTIFEMIAGRRRQLVQAVSTWTWPNYARKHLDVWSRLLNPKMSADLANHDFIDGAPSLGTAVSHARLSRRITFAAQLATGSVTHTAIPLLRWARREGRKWLAR